GRGGGGGVWGAGGVGGGGGRGGGRLLAVAAGCASAAAAVGVTTLAEEGLRAAGAGGDRTLGQAVLDLLTGTRWGHLWLVREAALIALVAVILGIRSRLDEPATRRSTAR